MSLPSLKYEGWGQPPGGHRSMNAVISYLNRALATIGSGMSAAGTSLKVARMASALNNLSDHQLAQIGITRSDIKRHAKSLVSYEYDGL